MVDFDRYIEAIKSELSEKRYEHSMNVAAEARRLANKYGYDEDKAYIAGILHDICKDMPPDKQLKIIEESGIILSSVEKKAAKLWHALAGAAFVKERLGVDDEIADAIACHTTGKPGMSTLDKILYIADYISPERDDSVDEIRRLSELSLDDAVFEGLKYSLNYLLREKRIIHPGSVESYNQFFL